MKLSQLLKTIDILEATASPDLEITDLCYDSRSATTGCLFVAVTGFETDGHRFIPMAVEKGAAAVLCEKVPEGDVPYVRVANARLALALAAANWFGHPADKMQFVGVTGTNGKTTTTFLLKTVLEKTLGAKVGLVGTIQNMIGDEILETERTTPESYELQALFARMADAGCTHVIMEVSSHALALDRVAGIRFAVGAFTNLTQDHLDFHKTMEAYLEAKAILFTRSDRSVINLDDEAAARLEAVADGQVLTYGIQNPAALRATDVELASDHVAFTANQNGAAVPVRLGIPGGFTVYNALAVLGCAVALGVSLPDAAAALAQAHGVKGRVEVVPTPGKDYTILIDYAHTPDGLENVLRSVRGFCKGRLIAVFGCGGDRDPIKRPIMGRIGAELSDFAVITSDNPRTEDPHKIIEDILVGLDGIDTPHAVVENRRAAIRYAMDMAQKDDIIVLAGKGHETYQIIGKEKTHLDEREEVAAHLAGN
jgi:UDP-N-acetylmuramoyl-L-alanyl-D-glutamate--2,6-diaminopimelate ligase